ncbi:MAG: EthD family reductase [Anaerolineae bacterium]|nr:MAG: EthD family reductase [Anaerolineae bacterium]
MHKLVIIFLETFAPASFDRGWQTFLSLVEKMPGLQREVVSETQEWVFGPPQLKIRRIHELHFESREAMEAALRSEAGQKAAEWLHQFTQGRVLILSAEHRQATPDEFTAPEESP